MAYKHMEPKDFLRLGKEEISQSVFGQLNALI